MTPAQCACRNGLDLIFERSFFRNYPVKPRLARSLRVLCKQIDSRWPDRRTNVDGWLGDLDHVSRPSDHNPDARGVVCALDVTAVGIAPELLVRAAIAHPSTHYVIWAGRIWQHRNNFHPRTYDGSNPHLSHVHISVWHSVAAASDKRSWAL